jgi:hypothetical protein
MNPPADDTSPMELHQQVDVVSQSPDGERVVLSMVETRDWGTDGANLVDAQQKLYAYLDFVETGQIWTAYPAMRGKKVEFRLHARFAPTKCEEEFFTRAKKAFLDPLGITWSTVALSPDERTG